MIDTTGNGMSLRRMAAVSAILSGVLALGAIALLLIAVEFNFDLESQPAGLIRLGEGSALVFRWGEILGLFGYYVLLVPVAIYLWDWLKAMDSLLASLATLFGLGGFLVGAMGSTLRAGVFPIMMTSYAQASEPQRQALATDFQSVTDLVFVGLGSLESLLTGLWLLGIGLVLSRERRALGIVGAALGVGILGSGWGLLLQSDALARLDAAYFLSPFWAVWLGVTIARGGVERGVSPGAQQTSAATHLLRHTER